MSLLCRAAADAANSSAAISEPGVKTIIEHIKASAKPTSSAASIATEIQNDLRARQRAALWQVVEVGHTDNKLSAGPLEFYFGGGTLNVPPDARRFGGRQDIVAGRVEDETNIVGVLFSESDGRFGSLGAFLSVVEIRSLLEPHVDLVAPFVPTEVVTRCPATAAIGFPIRVQSDLSSIARQIVSKPSMRTFANRSSYLISIVPATEKDDFGSMKPKPIDFTKVTKGIRLLLVSENHHGTLANLALEGVDAAPRLRDASAVRDVVNDFHKHIEDTTIVFRVSPRATEDRLKLVGLAMELAARAPGPAGVYNPPSMSERQARMAAKPMNAAAVQRSAAVAQVRASLRETNANHVVSSEVIDVLEHEIATLDAILDHRTSEIALAKKLISDRSVRKGYFSRNALSVDEMLRRVLAESHSTRKLQRDLLNDVDKLSDVLRQAAIASEAARTAAARTELLVRGAFDRRDAAIAETHRINAKKDTADNELSALNTRIAAVEAAAAEHERVADTDAYSLSAADTGRHQQRIQDFTTETASILRGLHKAAAESAAKSEVVLYQKQKEARALLDELEAQCSKLEEESSTAQGQLLEIKARLDDATAQSVVAKRAADAAQEKADEALKAVDLYGTTTDRVAALKTQLAEARRSCDEIQNRVSERQRHAAAATTALHSSEADQRRLTGYMNEIQNKYFARVVERHVANEARDRAALVRSAGTEFLDAFELFLRTKRAVASSDGSRIVACRACYVIRTDAERVRQLEVSAANDEQRIKAAISSAEREAAAMVTSHAEELRHMQSLIESGASRVQALRAEAAARQAEARRTVSTEEERFESLAGELVRQIHQETHAAVHRLDAKIGRKTPTAEAGNRAEPADGSAHPGTGDVKGNEPEDASTVAQLYLQWCEAVDEAREAEARASNIRQQLMRLEHALSEATTQLSADRQAVAKLEVSVKETEEELQRVESAADDADQDQIQQRENMERAIRQLHDQGLEQCRSTEREIALADAAIASLKAQLGGLRREANAVSSQLETAGEPVTSLHRHVTELRRNNDLVAAQLHVQDSSHVLNRTATLARAPRSFEAASPFLDSRNHSASAGDGPHIASSRKAAMAASLSGTQLPYATSAALSGTADRFGDVPSAVQRDLAFAAAQRIVGARRDV